MTKRTMMNKYKMAQIKIIVEGADLAQVEDFLKRAHIAAELSRNRIINVQRFMHNQFEHTEKIANV